MGQASARTIRTVAALIESGLAPTGVDRAALDAVARDYAIAIPPTLAALIGDPDDPIGRQLVPHPDERVQAPGETADPTGDARFSPLPGLVRRYPDRVLLKPLLACPLYCRFCFRRAHVGPDGGLLTERDLEAALDWIEAEPDLREVILTGGDPMILSARRLGAIVARISAMRRIETIRIHTRLPVADPDRIDAALVGALETGKGMRVMVHVNAAAEVGAGFRASVRRLLGAGIPVLSQSVLLRGVNDTPARLEALLRALLAARVVPATLHQLDRAPGTARFEVPIEEGRALLSALRGRVPGDAWPSYTLDIEGGYGKVPIGPVYLADGATEVADVSGGVHALDPGRCLEAGGPLE